MSYSSAMNLQYESLELSLSPRKDELTEDVDIKSEISSDENEEIDADMAEADDQSGYFCILCDKHFLYQDDMVQHELKVHFSWTVKPYNLSLLYTLIRIIRVDSKTEAVDLRKELEEALEAFEKLYDKDVRCIDCQYLSRSRDDLIRHYKSSHVSRQDEDCTDDNDWEPDAMGNDPNAKETQNNVGKVVNEKDRNEQVIVDGQDVPCQGEDVIMDVDGEEDEDTIDNPLVSQENTMDEENTASKDKEVPVNVQEQHIKEEFIADGSEKSRESQTKPVKPGKLSPPKPGSGGKKSKSLVLDCGFCGKSFKDSRSLQRHAFAQHFPDFRCHLCDFHIPPHKRTGQSEVFLSAAKKMNLHLMRTHKITLSGNKAFPCSQCHIIASSENYLTSHVRRKHNRTLNGQPLGKRSASFRKSITTEPSSKGDKELKCNTCPEVNFSSKDQLARHLTEGLRHIALCQTCGLPTSPRATVAHDCPAQLGLKEFDKQQPFKVKLSSDGTQTCQLCGFNCSSGVTMLKHEALMHMRQPCPYPACVHMAKDRLGLHGHIKSQHKDMCHLCAEVAKHQEDLLFHNCAEKLLMPSHQKPDLVNPMLSGIHHNARPCGCPWCLKLIHNQTNWYDHRKKCRLAPPEDASTNHQSRNYQRTNNTCQRNYPTQSKQSVLDISLCQTCGFPPAERMERYDHQCPVQFGSKQFGQSDKFSFQRLENGDKFCNLCGFTCIADYTMLRHKALMHQQQRCPSQACIAVPEQDRLALQSHIRSKHPEMCGICAYVPKQTDTKEHNCAGYLLLPRDFQTRESTNPMIKRVTKWARPGACPTCFQVFNGTNNLFTHMKNGCVKLANNE